MAQQVKAHAKDESVIFAPSFNLQLPAAGLGRFCQPVCLCNPRSLQFTSGPVMPVRLCLGLSMPSYRLGAALS